LWTRSKETIVALRAELSTADETITALIVQQAGLMAQVATLMERMADLEKQRATNSRNSSKPPASDGPARRPHSLRGKSRKKPGGQLAHPGAHLRLMDTPDQVVAAHPAVCRICQGPLIGGVGVGMERRPVIDVPPARPMVTEYQGHTVRCPACHATTGVFPPDVTAPVQYGPRVRAVTVYLMPQQLLPYGRTREVLTDLLGCPVSEGRLTTLVQEAADRLAPVEERRRSRERCGRERCSITTRRAYPSRAHAGGCTVRARRASRTMASTPNVGRRRPMPWISCRASRV